MFEIIETLKTLQALRADKRGVTALEYALIAAAVATTIVVGFTKFGNNLSAAFNNLTV